MSNFIIYHSVFIVNKQNPAEAGLCLRTVCPFTVMKEKEINLNHTIHKVFIWFSATFFLFVYPYTKPLDFPKVLCIIKTLWYYDNTNKIFLQLLGKKYWIKQQDKWTSWTIITRVRSYYFTLLYATKFLVILVGLGVAQGK